MEKILLVGWDGADWQLARPLIDEGRMPQLQDIVTHGCHGDIESLPPYLSPMLWNTISTGKHPAEHGIVGFTECNPATGKIQPMSSVSRKVKALWNMLSQEGRRCHVFGWFASHPAESINGRMVAETFAKFGKNLKTEAPTKSVSPFGDYEDLSDLRVSPREVDKNLLEFFIPGVREVNLDRDPRPLKLLERLSELYTLHNCAVATLEDDPQTEFLAIYYHFIDWICHDFMEYGPPRRANILERDFKLYSQVVEKAYELQDLLLRDLLRAAGPGAEIMIVSDHGFLSGEDRPVKTPEVTAGIAAWHRPLGMLAMAGRTWKEGHRVEGASLFDVTPTLLHRFGLPVGQDMQGRVLTGAFRDEQNKIQQIRSWETYGPSIEESFSTGMSKREAADVLRQFAELGYINLDRDPFETAEEMTRRENNWNLGQSLMSVNRIEEALPYLEEAWFCNPEQPYLALPLARCQARLGLIDESKRTAETLRDFEGKNPEVPFLLADLHRLWGEYDQAQTHLESAEILGGDPVRVAGNQGLCLLHLERFQEAETLFTKLVNEHPSFPFQLGLCRAMTRQGKLEEAESLVKRLLRDHPHNANLWFTHGQLLDRRGNPEETKAAFAKALEIEPAFRNAQVNEVLQEAEIRRSKGQPVIWDVGEIDFRTGETPSDRDRKQAEQRIDQLRQQSQQRLEEWTTRRDAQRKEQEPLTVLEAPLENKWCEPVEPIVIVTGLPRSGTSMMMQMLEAGGVQVKTDHVRKADDHNPRGYYEWEAIKELRNQPEAIDEAAGRAVKVVSPQITALPAGRAYKFIWMDRPVREIFASQARMLGKKGDLLDSGKWEAQVQALTQHRQDTFDSLKRTAEQTTTVELFQVSYPDCVANPEEAVAGLQRFLGTDVMPHASPSARVVDKILHRSREKND